MSKTIANACCCTLSVLVSLAASAAIPVRWTADAYKVKPLSYECYHGETLDLSAALTAYGEPLDFSGKTARLYWQTNGMATAWWSTNAFVRVEAGATNVLAAVWSGAYDTGAASVTGFIGVEGENYRAAFELRFRASPGFSPSTLPTPTKAINWSAVVNENVNAAPFVVKGGEGGVTLSQVTNVANVRIDEKVADWAMKPNTAPVADLTPATNYTDYCCRALANSATNYTDVKTGDMATKTWVVNQGYETTTNATATYQPKGDYLTSESDPTAYAKMTNAVESGYLCTVAAASAMTNALPNWTKSANKPTYTADDVGALPAEETASDYYEVSPGVHVNWLDISCNFSIGPQYQMYWDGQKGVLGGSGSVWYYGGTDESHEIAVKGDIPDAYTKTEADAAFATKAEQAATQAIVQTWEGFLDGSNVVFSITNYISGTYSLNEGKFKVLELTNGVYREVYDSRSEIVLHINNFKDNDFRTATNSVITSVDSKIADKADKAWGKYTSAGGEAPSNTVYMTAPNTVFAGGLEYERVAVGEGAVCVLTTKGAPTWTQGDEGTFKFQDDGGTNYFGFAKTDSYVIGCDTDGISVQNHIVTLRYDITMSGVPCIWYKEDIASNVAWEQLNTPDGQPIAGASHVLSWEQNPQAGQELCYINCPEAKGYFKATIEVAGEAKFMTNMPADLGGGIMCTNTATGVNGKIKPSFNGSSVIWTWSAF